MAMKLVGLYTELPQGRQDHEHHQADVNDAADKADDHWVGLALGHHPLDNPAHPAGNDPTEEEYCQGGDHLEAVNGQQFLNLGEYCLYVFHLISLILFVKNYS